MNRIGAPQLDIDVGFLSINYKDIFPPSLSRVNRIYSQYFDCRRHFSSISSQSVFFFLFFFVVFPNRQKDLMIKTDIFCGRFAREEARILLLVKPNVNENRFLWLSYCFWRELCTLHELCTNKYLYLLLCVVFDSWLIEETDLVYQVRSCALSRKVYFRKKMTNNEEI